MKAPTTSHILIIDDEPAGRQVLEMLLLPQGYQLSMAENGPQGLAMASQLVPDLILLDVMLPGMDGFEVCKRLRSDALLAEIPIFMLTALDDYDSRLKGFEAGADDFLTKPVDGLELWARVRSITRVNRYHHLLSERARFQHLFELAPYGIALTDGNGIITLVNQALLRLTGEQDPHAWVGQPLSSLVIPEQTPSFDRVVKDALMNASSSQAQEWNIRRMDGQTLRAEIEITLNDWKDETNLQVTVHDITRFVEAQQALQASEILHQRLVDESPMGLLELDFQSYPTRVIHGNRRFGEISGWDPASLPGMFLSDYCTPDYQSDLNNMLAAAQTGRVVHCQTIWAHRDGSSYPVHLVACPVFTHKGQRILLAVEDLMNEGQSDATPNRPPALNNRSQNPLYQHLNDLADQIERESLETSMSPEKARALFSDLSRRLRSLAVE